MSQYIICDKNYFNETHYNIYVCVCLGPEVRWEIDYNIPMSYIVYV